MNIERVLAEARRVEPVDKTKDSPQKQAIRAPGDVGKVDRLKQMDKDKKGPALRPVPGVRGAFRLKKRNVEQPSQYIDRVSDEAGVKRVAPDESEISYKADGKKLKKTYKPSQDRVLGADKDFDDLIQDAGAAKLRNPAETDTKAGQKDVTVKDRPYLRHAYQPSGLGINKELQDSDLDYIIKSTQDTDPIEKSKRNTKLTDMGGLENLSKKVKDPTARDLENLDPSAEAEGAKDRAYLTPEVMKQQKDMRKALSRKSAKKRSEGVQALAFQHEVSDEMVDKFIERFGKARDTIKGPGKNYLIAQLEGRGLDKAREKEAWGGDLGKAGEIYKNKNGTYNFTKMPESLRRQAFENRAKDMVRTYLRQGGRDAYAMHEGIRSIADMDLEHISSLKGKGASAGRDGPDNWVWASSPLNMQRAENELTADEETGEEGTITKYAEGPKDADRGSAFKTYQDLAKGNPELDKKFQAEFGGKLSKTGGTGPLTKGKYNQYSKTDIEGLRQQARKIGLTSDQAKAIFPDVRDPSKEAVSGGGTMPLLGVGRDAYDKSVTEKQRNRVMVNDLLQQLKAIPEYKKMGESELLKTPEALTLLDQIKKGTPSPRMKSDFEDDL